MCCLIAQDSYYPNRKVGGVENTGSGGKHGISVENMGSKWKYGGTIISPNNEVEILLFQIAMKITFAAR